MGTQTQNKGKTAGNLAAWKVSKYRDFKNI